MACGDYRGVAYSDALPTRSSLAFGGSALNFGMDETVEFCAEKQAIE